MSEAKTKVVATALDGLPYGNYTAESVQNRDKKEKIKYPEGITGKRLMRDVLVIAWPSLVELILAQLTGTADQIMVGRMAGKAGVIALGAVGLSAQPKFLLMTMIQALNVGSTAVIARFRGQQNKERANQVFMQSLLLNFIMGLFFSVIGLAFSTQLLHFISGSGVSEDLLQGATTYLDINMYGLLPLALTFTMTAALRGVGDSRTPLIYNTVSNLVNLLFNYMLIYGKFGFPEMGIAGAALATVIGQTVAFVIALIVFLRKTSYIRISFRGGIHFDLAILKNVVSIGLPSMIEQLFMRAGMIIFTRAVAGLGDIPYATHQICMSLQSMSFMLGQAFATSTTTLMGQSLGKRRYDMAVLYMREAQKLGLIVSCILAVLLMTFSHQLVGLFNTTPEVIEIGGQILFVIAFAQPIQAAQFIVAGGMRGAGDTRFSAIVTAITVFGIRSIFVVILVNVLHMGIWGAWIAIMADQCMRTVLMMAHYRTGKWARIGLNQSGVAVHAEE